MSPEHEDASRPDVDEAERMQTELDKLGDHIDEGVGKAQATRDQARPNADESLKEVAGDWTGTDDDASGAVDADDDGA